MLERSTLLTSPVPSPVLLLQFRRHTKRGSVTDFPSIKIVEAWAGYDSVMDRAMERIKAAMMAATDKEMADMLGLRWRLIPWRTAL